MAGASLGKPGHDEAGAYSEEFGSDLPAKCRLMLAGHTFAPQIRRSRLAQAARLLVRHRQLIWLMALRELRDRYAGSALGVGWAVVQPLLLMIVLIVVLGFAFGPRATGQGYAPIDYASYVVAGYLPWLIIAASLQGSTSIIVANPGLVKQIDFPLEVLPVKTVIAQVVPQLVGVVGLVAYDAAVHLKISGLLLLVPVVIAIQLFFVCGLCWLAAAIGAYFRDADQILQSLLLVNIYLLPIFFLPEMTPNLLRPIVAYNPFSPVVWVFQDALYYGEFRHPGAWGVFLVLSFVSFAAGLAVFRRAKPGFGDLV
jgi:lipopolysaccharide transport system permease protein